MAHSIGTRIRELRKQKKMTQQALATAANIAVNSVRLYESGKVSPTVDALEKIAAALGCTITDLDYSIIEAEISEARAKDKAFLLNFIKKSDEFNLVSLNEINDTLIMDWIEIEYKSLNRSGKIEALKRVQELTLIEKYTAPDSSKKDK